MGVVLASGGYPGQYRQGLPIEGVSQLDPECLLFHAGTRPYHDEVSGKTYPVTSGGRVLTVVAQGTSLEEARRRAYRNARCIRFEGMHYRKDIAATRVQRGVTYAADPAS